MEHHIKNEVYSQIDKYKNGTEQEKKIGNKIEEFAKNIECFRCLDTKQTWYYRGIQFENDGKGDFCKFSCPTCLSDSLKNKWIEDTKTCELYSQRKFKIFNRESYSGTKRFVELEKFVIRTYPDLIKPEFKTSKINSIKTKKSTKKLDIEVGNIIDKCTTALKAYYGNFKSISNLLNDLELNISNINEDSDKINTIYDEIEDNKFIFIKVKNNSSMTSSSIACIYKYDKYNLDIDININEIQTLNRSANIICKEIINKNANDNINLIKYCM